MTMRKVMARTLHGTLHKRGLIFLFAGVVLLGVGKSMAQDQPDPITAALQQLGLSWEAARMNPKAMEVFGDDGGLATPLFGLLHERWWLIPAHTQVMREGQERLLGSLGWAVVAGSVQTGVNVRRQSRYTDNDKLAEETSLVSAIEHLYQAKGSPLDPSERKRLATAVAAIPQEFAQAVALLLGAAIEAAHRRDGAFRHVSDLKQVVKREHDVPLYDPGLNNAGYDLIFQVDYAALFVGAADLGYALDAILSGLPSLPSLAQAGLEQAFYFRWDSPLGVILLSCRQEDNAYPPEPYLLLIDCGGNDTYRGGGGASLALPVSVLIDLSGNDVYAGQSGQFGSGQFGYGFLVDLAGNDTYTVTEKGLGFGRYGVGILTDATGNDTYATDSLAQGAGAMGMGLLLDGRGDDHYTAFQFSQGFGFTRGFGLLLDAEGDDRYHANDTEIRYPSPQTPEHNLSFCQGAASGNRSDDGHSLAGGTGMLLDGSGNDSYSAGVYAQGAGYWYGMGGLIDVAGNDTYTGVWYVQGSGAHFALGLLRDFAGQDHYLASHHVAQGAGHDFSLGFFMDDAGSDQYEAASLSRGAGNDNGIGVFVDRTGKDVYTISKRSLGFARLSTRVNSVRSLRHHLLCLGLFLDLGGQDVYTFSSDKLRTGLKAGNNTEWFHQDEVALGLGVDGAYPAFSFPDF